MSPWLESSFSNPVGEPNPDTVVALQNLNLREVGDPRGLAIDPASTGEAVRILYACLVPQNPA